MRENFIKMKLLEGKKALVTGSSRGIGCAIAKDLAANGGKADIVRADLCDQNSTDRLIESIGTVCLALHIRWQIYHRSVDFC